MRGTKISAALRAWSFSTTNEPRKPAAAGDGDALVAPEGVAVGPVRVHALCLPRTGFFATNFTNFVVSTNILNRIRAAAPR